MNNKTKKLVLNGLMIALVCIATMTFQIPTPGTNGYVNVGDAVIFITSILFGPVPGMVAGGIGSALADILSGYTHWALFTLIIKGLEGYLVGVIIGSKNTLVKSILSTLLGSITMVFGYFLAGAILEGSFLVSLSSIPSNSVQGLVCMIIAIPLAYSLSKVDYIKTYRSNVNS
ncbi:ECF transporter S component [Romboutsia weinsteinii]|uniref:ECF transporter S component n=1 Tax=Romboutsia weinsteinii TaxID=2020949 RepID=A0A371IZ31_9FIRM|nr:ECF transporter S component [Romboutsia weinsteinii]RDY25742.1 ECF transporter S component [Romboutsia weinsteinii]